MTRLELLIIMYSIKTLLDADKVVEVQEIVEKIIEEAENSK